jgi:hypothetical protein
MSETVTQWFGGDVEPEHIGVYQRDYSGEEDETVFFYSMWDGTVWLCGFESLEQATLARIPSAFQWEPWRGLAEKPKG